MDKKRNAVTYWSEPVPTITEPKLHLGGPQSGFPPPFIVGQDLAPYLIVGMDLGVNYCRVSTFENNRPIKLTPHEYRALVEDALDIVTTDSQMVHSIKQCLAGNYVTKRGKSFYKSDEITRAFLLNVKSHVERSSERLLAKSVFSVPSGFNHSQRKTLIKAATNADIAVLGLINEPTAAALDACFTNNLTDGKYLVISSGSYSLETSVVDVQNQLIEVKVSRSAQKLGGRALTLAVVDAIAALHPGCDTDMLHILVDRSKATLDANNTLTSTLAPRNFIFLERKRMIGCNRLQRI